MYANERSVRRFMRHQVPGQVGGRFFPANRVGMAQLLETGKADVQSGDSPPSLVTAS